MSEGFGPWIVWGKQERPDGLRDEQRIQVVFISQSGNIYTSKGCDRSVDDHSWKTCTTLAYRVNLENKTHVFYGPDCGFSTFKLSADTHKLTYVLDQYGGVVSCKMEKL